MISRDSQMIAVDLDDPKVALHVMVGTEADDVLHHIVTPVWLAKRPDVMPFCIPRTAGQVDCQAADLAFVVVKGFHIPRKSGVAPYA